LLQLERLKRTALKDVAVLVITPDPTDNSRAFIARVENLRRVRLTHRFLALPRERTLKRPATGTEGKAPRLPPSLVLVDREGREAWRFVEGGHWMRPTDRQLARAVADALRP